MKGGIFVVVLSLLLASSIVMSSSSFIPTLEVGGATFERIKWVSTPDEILPLAAFGRSYLSYLYMGVCSSVLYLRPGLSPDEASSPIVLEIVYHKPVRAKELIWATNHFIAGNYPLEELPSAIKEEIDSFNGLYKGVRVGDRYTLEHVPGRGISLYLNGELLGVTGSRLNATDGKQLARAIFSIWLGRKAFSTSMRDDLLTPIDPPVQISSDLHAKENGYGHHREERKGKQSLDNEEKELLRSIGILDHVTDDEAATANRPRHSWWSKFGISSALCGLFCEPEPDSSHQQAVPSDLPASESSSSSSYSTLGLLIGGAAILLPHLAVLLSLPPVLMKRGAPYLPTFGNKMDVMFGIIRAHIKQQRSKNTKPLKFVDLGSGDGRVVFRAAREGLFKESVGYEINPTLHIFACLRKMITPKYWPNTKFRMGDLWRTDLSRFDVVAVYGLSPIMDRLGSKLKDELRPGSIVVSNVFSIPGWRTSTVTSEKGTGLHGKGVFLYEVPECFKKSD